MVKRFTTDRLELALRAAIDSSHAAAAVAELLGRLSLKEKVRVVRSLHGAGIQRRLWKAASAGAPLSMPDLVPETIEPMKPVVFHGKNSLPALSHFRKICCRPHRGDAILWGYNDTPIAPLIGPGYYVVHSTAGSPLGGVAFDYTRIPDGRMPMWPPLRPNGRGISRLVYAGMIDYMRRLGDDVFIGSATRNGAELGNYFIVVRELPG